MLDDSGSFLWEDDGWFSPRPAAGPTSTCSPTAHDHAAALEAFYAAVRAHAGAAALDAGQLVEPLPPLQRATSIWR